MYKLSQYIAETSFYDEKLNTNKTLVLSTRTLKFFYIDSYRWQKIKDSNFEQLEIEIFQHLKSIKVIVDSAVDELSEVLIENRNAVENGKTLQIAIQPSAHCSFGCGYCGQKHSKDKLKLNLQDAILKRIEHKIACKPYKVLSICWFGSEPLSGIQIIRSLSPKIHQLCEKHSLKYSGFIITNGISLSNKIADELINELKVTRFEITLDGLAEYHDKRRHLKDGSPTFDKVYANLLNLVHRYGSKVNITIRSNIDDRNMESVIPLIDKLYQDNILQHIRIYFAPIHAWGNDAHKLIHSKQQWAENEIDWMIHLHDRGHASNLLYDRKYVQCMAVTDDAELIDPYGNIFNCTEVSLTPAYEKNGINIHKIGHVFLENNQEQQQRDGFRKFVNKEELQKYPCYSCNIFPICGGACPKEWMEGKSPCPSIKYNIKERMLLTYIWRQEMHEKSDANFEITDNCL
ncbi:MAG: radical SAM/SPASM domain-containing protein [Gammaproteobacteria bacterium]